MPNGVERVVRAADERLESKRIRRRRSARGTPTVIACGPAFSGILNAARASTSSPAFVMFFRFALKSSSPPTMRQMHALAVHRELDLVVVFEAAHDAKVRPEQLESRTRTRRRAAEWSWRECRRRCRAAGLRCAYPAMRPDGYGRSGPRGPVSGSPTASDVTLSAAVKYRSSSTGETPKASAMLSKPYAESSGGNIDEVSISSASKSRMALAYSARLNR